MLKVEPTAAAVVAGDNDDSKAEVGRGAGVAAAQRAANAVMQKN
jgi:hypothetical protein